MDFTYDSAAYTSRGLSIVSAPEKFVNLKLSGDGYAIGSLHGLRFCGLSGLVQRAGQRREEPAFAGAERQSALLTGVSVSIEGGDNTVDVVFDVVEEKTLPITVTTNYLTIADGYILYGTDVSKETVTLSGPSTELSQVETCTAEVAHKGDLTEPVTLTTALRFYTRSGSEVKFAYTTLEEESVDVTLQVYKVATLPVEVSFINAPRDFDSSVLAYTLSKKTLNVAGPESQIDRLSALSVGTIDLSTFALDKVYEMPIELPTGIHLLDNLSSITVSFDSSKLETKTLNLPSSCVQVVNLPSSYQLTVETERLMNVTLCGPAGSLETLTPEQVVIEIDADDFSVAIGQQNIACRLYVPVQRQNFCAGQLYGAVQDRKQLRRLALSGRLLASSCSPFFSPDRGKSFPKGEPLAKPETLRGLPRPLTLGEVALRSNDGEGKDAENKARNLE